LASQFRLSSVTLVHRLTGLNYCLSNAMDTEYKFTYVTVCVYLSVCVCVSVTLSVNSLTGQTL